MLIDERQVDFRDLQRLVVRASSRAALKVQLRKAGRDSAVQVVQAAERLADLLARTCLFELGTPYSKFKVDGWVARHLRDWTRFWNHAYRHAIPASLFFRAQAAVRGEVPFPSGLCSDTALEIYERWTAREGSKVVTDDDLIARLGNPLDDDGPDPLTWCIEGIQAGNDLMARAQRGAPDVSPGTLAFIEQAVLPAAYLATSSTIAGLYAAGSLPERTKSRLDRAYTIIESPGVLDSLTAGGWLSHA